mmetsp:Transcript_108255/g.149608  ORF Transcript_108255/g.149608 Transcript_108255/m.149608 type:complete len:107 (-) Transcript_108255:568-888(-)
MDRGETDFHREHSKHRENLEGSVIYLRDLLQKGQNVAKTENTKIMGQNVQLIQEINELRKEMQDLKRKTKLLKGLHQVNDSQRDLMKDATEAQRMIGMQDTTIKDL